MPANKLPAAKPLPEDALIALQELIKISGSQTKAAARLGLTESSISHALKGRYIGNVERMAERIRGELLNETVTCPYYGQINRRICQDTREAPLTRFQNPYQRSLRLHCNQCINNPATQAKKEQI